MTRTEKMLKNWNEEGRAFSNLNNDDNYFLSIIGIPYDKLGITSQTGLDIVYYNTEIFLNDTDALRNKRTN